MEHPHSTGEGVQESAKLTSASRQDGLPVAHARQTYEERFLSQAQALMDSAGRCLRPTTTGRQLIFPGSWQDNDISANYEPSPAPSTDDEFDNGRRRARGKKSNKQAPSQSTLGRIDEVGERTKAEMGPEDSIEGHHEGVCSPAPSSVASDSTVSLIAQTYTPTFSRSRPPPHKQPETKTIETYFAHPMIFNHIPPPDGSLPCHFCEDFAFGIKGYGKTKAEVVDYKDGNGYHEIQGGHIGKEATRMCMLCALDRMHVVNCHEHSIGPITEGPNPDEFQHFRAKELLEQRGIGLEDCPFPYCSLCQAPAFFKCCRRQTRNKWDEKIVSVNQEGAFGCGLMLCDVCAGLVKRCEGTLHPAVKVLEKRLKSWERESESGLVRAERLTRYDYQVAHNTSSVAQLPRPLRADIYFLLNGNDTRQWHD